MESRAEVEGGRPPLHVHEDSLTHSRSQQAQSVARESKKQCIDCDRPSQIYSFDDGEPRDANQTPIKNAVALFARVSGVRAKLNSGSFRSEILSF